MQTLRQNLHRGEHHRKTEPVGRRSAAASCPVFSAASTAITGARPQAWKTLAFGAYAGGKKNGLRRLAQAHR